MLRLQHNDRGAHPFSQGWRVVEIYDPFWEDLLRSRKNNESAYSFSWGQREYEIRDPFWEDLQRNIQPKASSAFRGCAAAIKSFFMKSTTRRLPVKANAVNDALSGAPQLHVPPRAVIRIARGEIFVRKPRNAATLEKPAQTHVPETTENHVAGIRNRLWGRIILPEFWLGLVFGAATRIATKLAIMRFFAGTPRFAIVAGFIACACAGVAAGIVIHLVHTRYRNSRTARGEEKENYTGNPLFESAVIGLFGGTLGGYVMIAGAIIAKAGSLAFGATAGVAAGLLHVGVTKYKTSSDHQQAELGWGKLAFQSAAFAAIGGICGVISADIFGIHGSIAAPVPVGEADTVIYVHPSVSSNMPELCPTDTYGPPPPIPQAIVAPLAPVQSVTVEMPEAPHIITTPAPHPVHHVVHHRVPHNPCKAPKVTHKHIVKHVHHRKPVEEITIIKQPVQPLPLPLPPPQVIMPTPVAPPPIPIDPCETGLCAPHCNTSQLDIKGPCADPHTPCVEKISFNEKGEATSAILEPRAGNTHGPYFEIETPTGTKIASWGSAAKDVVLSANAVEGASKVALVMPFGNAGTTAA